MPRYAGGGHQAHYGLVDFQGEFIVARKKEVRKRPAVRVIAAFAAAAVILTVGIGVFFNINEITVTGAGGNYTEEEIISASGLKIGRSLLFTDTIAAQERIKDVCPYVSTVTVTKEYPSKVLIDLRESSVSAAVEFNGEIWLLDQDCRVLGKAETEQQCMVITGMTVKKVSVGSTVEIEDDYITKLDCLKTILAGMSGNDFSKRVTEIDIANIGHIELSIGKQYTIKIGSAEKLEYKLTRAESVISQLADEKSAVIDVSKDGETYVTPEE